MNPAGAGFSSVAAGASSAMARMGRVTETVDLSCLGVEKDRRDCFHGAVDLGTERAGVKREA